MPTPWKKAAVLFWRALRLRCPHCGALGTAALKYGPGATPEEAEVLALLDGSGSAGHAAVPPP